MPSAGGCESGPAAASSGPGERAPAAPAAAAAAAAAAPPRPRLCGYLQRLSGKGPLRGFRSRWFVFEPGRCSLYYFKGPQEALPLGRLDIARAAFTLHHHATDHHQYPPASAAAAAAEGHAAGDPQPHHGQPPDAPRGTAFEIHSPGGAVTVLKSASDDKVGQPWASGWRHRFLVSRHAAAAELGLENGNSPRLTSCPQHHLGYCGWDFLPSGEPRLGTAQGSSASAGLLVATFHFCRPLSYSPSAQAYMNPKSSSGSQEAHQALLPAPELQPLCLSP
uniref:Uncharacterized protein n=1 Tax=Sphaerodactylus townsendi TaxID=933632 RepID=A0ACB8E5F2_9SAUR